MGARDPFEDLAPPTLLDRLIGYVSPTAGLRRMHARRLLTRAHISGAKDPWKPRRPGASANQDHQIDAAALRAKSRFLIENVDYIAAGMRWRKAVKTGAGIQVKWTGRDGKKLKSLWDQWGPVADADGVRDIHGLIADADETLDRDGEVLMRLRPRRPSDGLPVPLQLQLLEVDWLDNVRQVAPETGNSIVGGKEYGPLGQCVAYWLWSRHPGDAGTLRGVRLESKRVPADQVIHLYAPARPGAGRGFPRLAPVIARARDIQLLEDAELARKNLEGRLSVIASGNVASLTNGMPESTAMTTGSLGELAGGGINQVPAGLDLTVVEPKAAPGFVDYIKANVHMVCAGAGFSYEAATGDMTGVNFSSARIRQLDLKREIQQEQWLTLIPMLLRPICAAFANAASLSGGLGPVGRAVSYGCDFHPPKWDYVNPKDEIEADLLEVAGGLSSLSAKQRARGDDPDVVNAEWEADMKRIKGSGLWEFMAFLLKGHVPSTTTPTPDSGSGNQPTGA
jgi:lambda family phage portal protein